MCTRVDIIPMYCNVHCTGIVLSCGWKNDDKYTYDPSIMRNDRMIEFIDNNSMKKTIIWRENTYNDRFFISHASDNADIDISFRWVDNNYYIATYFVIEHKHLYRIMVIYDLNQHIDKLCINDARFI